MIINNFSYNKIQVYFYEPVTVQDFSRCKIKIDIKVCYILKFALCPKVRLYSGYVYILKTA